MHAQDGSFRHGKVGGEGSSGPGSGGEEEEGAGCLLAEIHRPSVIPVMSVLTSPCRQAAEATASGTKEVSPADQVHPAIVCPSVPLLRTLVRP